MTCAECFAEQDTRAAGNNAHVSSSASAQPKQSGGQEHTLHGRGHEGRRLESSSNSHARVGNVDVQTKTTALEAEFSTAMVVAHAAAVRPRMS